ncbi:hypothetical protein, partial [Acinetobacter indicus]|uniref:hypothetical protein n=1 Tax=Acinetobacter indicus TaxID=756892 RepID=UPI003F49EF9E|nr:hypothetical protein [Acinetobacter indicus]
KGPEPEAGADQKKGPEPEAGADQEKGPEPEVDEKQDKPALKPNQLRVFNKGRASFCHVSGQTIPANKTVVLSYQDAAKKARAANNFKQLNGLAGHVRFQVEG